MNLPLQPDLGHIVVVEDPIRNDGDAEKEEGGKGEEDGVDVGSPCRFGDYGMGDFCERGLKL